MIKLYHSITKAGEKPLTWLLKWRTSKGKEDPSRLHERMGSPQVPRPEGALVWVHAASVGEAQSTLILIERLLRDNENLHVLLTTGTLGSAQFLAPKLPARCIHQFYPLDHPAWVAQFLDHWQPQLALWMESELWPNMLAAIKQRNIIAALVNARLSYKSYKSWNLFKKHAAELLSTFHIILAQTGRDEAYFTDLGAGGNIIVTDNLKYSARALPADEAQLKILSGATLGRKIWLYASSHEGEEYITCRLHQILKNRIPDLLTIIVPRHPDRREDIAKTIESHRLKYTIRGTALTPPGPDDDIYLADTFGELGLFYRLAPLACIGRSFSRDGGGGHNPIEAAQLHCGVLHGPHVQFQQDIFDEMDREGAALRISDEAHFRQVLEQLLTEDSALTELQEKAAAYAAGKTAVIDRVMEGLSPLLTRVGIEQKAPPQKAAS